MTNTIKVSSSRALSGGNRSLSMPVVIGLAITLSILFGATVAFFGSLIGFLLSGFVIGATLLTTPRATVWVTVVGGLAIAGLVELYLPDFQVIRWAFAMLSIALAVISTVKWLADIRKKLTSSKEASALAAMLALFAFASILSIIAGGSSLSNAVVGLKNYFQMWGLILALAWLGDKPIDASRFMKFIGLLSIVQIPFALHQFLFLVPLRSGVIDAAHSIVAVDVVAGTFGGRMAGGGRSADLAVLASLAVTLFFAQWKNGFRSLGTTVLLSALAFAPILLNEAKLALVLLPVGIFLLFLDSIVKRPFSWLLGASVMSFCMVAIIAIYSMLPGAESQKSKSVADFVSSSIDYNVGERGYGNSILNRSTVYHFWWNEHRRTGDIIQTLLGHGLGFSNESAIRRGDNPNASRYVSYAIGLTGISSLLWDTGVVGASAFVLMLLMAFLLSQRLAEKWHGTLHVPFVQTAQIGIVMLALSLLHNDYVAFDVGFQTMMAVVIGYLFAMASASTEGAS